MKRYKRIVLLILITSFLFTFLHGCKAEKNNLEKIQDLDFTVLEESDIPKDLKKIIDEKKTESFKLSFTDQKYLYIVRGYGAQPSGGYSIKVKELYLTENAIYFKTELIGPSQQDLVTQVITYPYIVIKIENIDKSVVFD